MRLLAIDPGSYNCGWYDGEHFGTWVLGKPGETPLPARLCALFGCLESRDKGDFVAVEETFMRGIAATAALNKVIGVIELQAQLGRAGVLHVSNSEVRKWATGTGRKQVAKKADADNPMLNRARQLLVAYGQPSKNLDEHSADAVCLWHYVMEMHENGG